MDVLFLSHCVPNPPDKGEKIRAFHEISQLAERFRVHLACFARSAQEVEDARRLGDRCASVHVERLRFGPSLALAGARFAAGGCLNQAFYSSAKLKSYAVRLAQRHPIRAALAYTVVMAPFVPVGMPYLLDMIDVDSEKWFQYGRSRRPGFLYALEANRLRRMEIDCARRASGTYLSTEAEASLFRNFCPDAAVGHIENGVDFELFDPAAVSVPSDLAGHRFVTFTGTMDYYPNVEAVCWFAQAVLPLLRQRDPNLEFLIVGRNPAPAVLKLAGRAGIRVTGGVPDTRPYREAALAEVVPLKIARGIQNKVLEALAMGRPALVSPAVARTFGLQLPDGVVTCDTPEQWSEALFGCAPAMDPAQIRGSARARFTWTRNFQPLLSELGKL